MNVIAHQEKKKNEETKTSMKKAEEGRRQATNFREAMCCTSAVVQGAAWQKMVRGGVPEVTGSLGKVNSHFDQTGSGTAPPH